MNNPTVICVEMDIHLIHNRISLANISVVHLKIWLFLMYETDNLCNVDCHIASKLAVNELKDDKILVSMSVCGCYMCAHLHMCMFIYYVHVYFVCRHMYVCMYVCMYVSMYVCKYACMYVGLKYGWIEGYM